MRRLILVLLAATAVAATAGGCGGDDDASSAAGSEEGDSWAVSKAAFIKRATEVCQKDREDTLVRVGEYQEEHSSDGLPKALLGKMAVVAGLTQTIQLEVDHLEELDLPAGEEKQVEALIASVQSAIDKAKASKTDSPKKFAGYFVAVNQELREYGLKDCGK